MLASAQSAFELCITVCMRFTIVIYSLEINLETQHGTPQYKFVWIYFDPNGLTRGDEVGDGKARKPFVKLVWGNGAQKPDTIQAGFARTYAMGLKSYFGSTQNGFCDVLPPFSLRAKLKEIELSRGSSWSWFRGILDGCRRRKY